jgi:hypothetical protein
MDAFRRLLTRFLPPKIYDLVVKTKYLHFFATGVTGVLINLFATWFLTTFVFGLENYFSGYTIGIVLNLAFNFTVHTIVTFKARRHVFQRMLGFTAYSISMTLFQAWVVKTITPIVGLQWYLGVIASVIFIFSIVTFLLFKYFLFRDDGDARILGVPQLLLVGMFSSLVLHVTGLAVVLTHVGIDPLITGDSSRYLELAKNLLNGLGFGYFAPEGYWVPETYRTPGLPLILAPFLIVPWGLTLYLFLQTIVAATVLPFLVYQIGKQTLSERAGMIAAWMIALEPQVAFSSWSPNTETPFLVAGLLAVTVFLSIRNWQGCRLCFFTRILVVGFLAALSAYVRPANLFMMFLLFVVFMVADWFSKDWRDRKTAILALMVMLMFIFPWMARNAYITGVFGWSGAGKNVYVDYVASIRTIEKGSNMDIEKDIRVKEAIAEFGFKDEYIIRSPQVSSALTRSGLNEILQHPKTVIKLESLLLLSYFTNDNYYNQLIRLGFIDRVPDRISPSQVLLREGLSGIPRIFEEMRKQYFVPVVSRLYQFAILFLAGYGLYRLPRRIGVMLFLLIMFSAVTSTLIGFGLEARLRMSVMPMLFLLAGAALTHLYRPSEERKAGSGSPT